MLASFSCFYEKNIQNLLLLQMVLLFLRFETKFHNINMIIKNKIQELKLALQDYNKLSCDGVGGRIFFALGLARLVCDINHDLKNYLDDLKHDECKEVLGIKFAKITQKDAWPREKLVSHMKANAHVKLSDMDISVSIDGIKMNTPLDILKLIEDGISNMIEQLKTIRGILKDAPKGFYANFYFNISRDFDDETVTADYEEWCMGIRDMTFKRIKAKQTIVVADFLKTRLLTHALPPTKQEIDEVQMDKVLEHLPKKYEIPDDFEQYCAIFRRFAYWDGHSLLLDYDTFGNYLYRFYYKLKPSEIQLFFEFDAMLKMINETMERVIPIEEGKKAMTDSKAEKYWCRLKEYGFVDDNCMLMSSTSRMQAMYIADLFAEKLGIKNKWNYFEQLWKIRKLAQEKWKSQQTGTLPPKYKDIDEIFKD